jgi:hypothetical protein
MLKLWIAAASLPPRDKIVCKLEVSLYLSSFTLATISASAAAFLPLPLSSSAASFV